MGWTPNASFDFLQKLASQQIKIYNKDTNAHFLRFYQTWV